MNDAVNLSSVNDIASVCSGYGDDDVFDAFSHNALHITVSLYHPHFRTETTSKWWAHSFFVLLVCSAFASNKYQMTTSQIFIWRCSLFVHPEFGLIDVWLKMNWLVVYGGQSTPGAEIAWQQITLNWYSKIGPGTVIKPRLTKLSLSLSETFQSAPSHTRISRVTVKKSKTLRYWFSTFGTRLIYIWLRRLLVDCFEQIMRSNRDVSHAPNGWRFNIHIAKCKLFV